MFKPAATVLAVLWASAAMPAFAGEDKDREVIVVGQ